MIGARDGNTTDARDYLIEMLTGMGDEISSIAPAGFMQKAPRILRELNDKERIVVQKCWIELWKGTLASQQTRKSLEVREEDEGFHWQIGE